MQIKLINKSHIDRLRKLTPKDLDERGKCRHSTTVENARKRVRCVHCGFEWIRGHA